MKNNCSFAEDLTGLALIQLETWETYKKSSPKIWGIKKLAYEITSVKMRGEGGRYSFTPLIVF
jgi:hypothetical protein